jgi:adenosylcobinamide-phosphate synthase
MPLFVSALLGVMLDALLGEPRRWHPLVGFGRLAGRVEGSWNAGSLRKLRGLLAWTTCVVPFVFAAAVACRLPWGWIADALLLYFALGARSLGEHGVRVANDLDAGDLPAAREHVGWMVSRDTSELDTAGVAKATVESVLENGNDAVFGALFWFALLGGPGALLFRLANTLDAMWGYRNERYLHFGWAAARIDDVLNFVPARLTALTYALLGKTQAALSCWRAQAPQWDSPNAGPVMAAGAGALDIRLGGAAIYHGAVEERPVLGTDRAPLASDIRRAVALVRKGLLLWLLVIVAATVANELLHA